MPDLRHPGRPAILLGLGAVLIIALIGGGLLVARHLDRVAEQTASPSPSPSSACSGQKTSSVTRWSRHVDRQAGFTICYPTAWTVFSVPAGAQFYAGPDAANYVEVRVIDLGNNTIQPGDTQLQKDLIDKLLAGQPITVVRSGQVSYANLTGWEYVYTFAAGSQGTALHVHIFLFDGNKLHTIVFQALPSTHLSDLAKTFDDILSQYQVLSASPSSSAAASTPTAASSP